MFIRASRVAGSSLVEFLMAASIGVILLGSISSFWLYSSNSFAVIFDYVDLDNRSQIALDRFSQQIRSVKSLKVFGTNQLTFIDSDGVDLVFSYDPAKRTLTRTKAGVSAVFLTECDSLQFSIFQRNPRGGSYDQYPAGTTNTCKLVQVQWTCSRTLYGQKATTETMKSGKTVIRSF